MRRRVAIVALAAAACGPRGATSADPARDVPVDPASAAERLPGDLIPRRGEVELAIDPERPDYQGVVRYTVEVRTSTDTVWLNARDLDVAAATVRSQDGTVEAERMIVKANRGLIGLQLPAPLSPGAAHIEIRFAGKLGDRNGLFRQRYRGAHYVFSDFEPIDARRAFPCFDDPRFKHPWSIAITAPRSSEAFSNAPVASTEVVAGGRRRIQFEPTPPLPTYLVGIAVGPFTVTAGPTSPVPMRVIAPRGHPRSGKFALEIAPAMLAELERYVAMPSPYRKLDFVAVPVFNGAMENPGLITFAAGLLLLADDAPEDDRLFLAGVMAHELAHLYFGDLVTMRWWNDLWLNEGIATWMSEKLVEAWRPQLRGKVLDVVDRLAALDEDRWRSARAVRAPIRGEAEIGGAFGVMSYRKGGAVIAMFEAFVGERVFAAALRRYLRAHAHGSADARDLYAAFGDRARPAIGDALDRYLSMPGVPLLRLEPSCTGNKATIAVTQRRYRLLSQPALGRDGAVWPVPVCVRYGDRRGERSTCAVIAARTGSLELPGDGCPDWIHPNRGERGYYYWSLPTSWLGRLVMAPGRTLSEREASGLADNVDALLAAGEIALADALAMWRELAARGGSHTELLIAQRLLRLWIATPAGAARQRVEAAVETIYGATARRVALSPVRGEPEHTAEIRRTVVELVGRVTRDPALVADASRLAREWLAGSADPPLLALVLGVAAASADPALFDALAARLAATTDPRERAALAYGLGSFPDSALTARALALIARGALGWSDVLAILVAAAGRPEAHGDVAVFLRDHRDALPDELIPRLAIAAEFLCSDAHADLVGEVAAARASVQDARAIDRAVAEIRQCAALRARLGR